MCIRKNDLENLDRIITSIKIKLQGLSEDSISVTVKQGDIHKYATDLLMTISSTTQQIDDAKARGWLQLPPNTPDSYPPQVMMTLSPMTLKPISSNWSNRYAKTT